MDVIMKQKIIPTIETLKLFCLNVYNQYIIMIFTMFICFII